MFMFLGGASSLELGSALHCLNLMEGEPDQI